MGFTNETNFSPPAGMLRSDASMTFCPFVRWRLIIHNDINNDSIQPLSLSMNSFAVSLPARSCFLSYNALPKAVGLQFFISHGALVSKLFADGYTTTWKTNEVVPLFRSIHLNQPLNFRIHSVIFRVGREVIIESTISDVFWKEFIRFLLLDMDVSENSGTPKSSILIGFSIINHPFWGTPIFGNTHIFALVHLVIFLLKLSACWAF